MILAALLVFIGHLADLFPNDKTRALHTIQESMNHERLLQKLRRGMGHEAASSFKMGFSILGIGIMDFMLLFSIIHSKSLHFFGKAPLVPKK